MTTAATVSILLGLLAVAPRHPAQPQNIQKLSSDLTAIRTGSRASAAQRQALASDLTKMASGANQSSQQSVQQLSFDLSKALSNSRLTSNQKAQLAKALGVVMDSANVSQVAVNLAISDVQALLSSSGVPQSDVKQIQADLQAIARTAQAGR